MTDPVEVVVPVEVPVVVAVVVTVLVAPVPVTMGDTIISETNERLIIRVRRNALKMGDFVR